MSASVMTAHHTRSSRLPTRRWVADPLEVRRVAAYRRSWRAEADAHHVAVIRPDVRARVASMLRRAVPLAAVVLLAGCATVQGDVTTIHDRLASLTRADVTQAMAIAKAADDPAGVACAEELLASLEARPTPLVPTGVVSTFMAAREARRGMARGISESVHRACAPLVVDAEAVLVKLGLTLTPAGSVVGSVLPLRVQ